MTGLDMILENMNHNMYHNLLNGIILVLFRIVGKIIFYQEASPEFAQTKWQYRPH
mgnify:CR=1 FL=1|jgi:hypothetical protein